MKSVTFHAQLFVSARNGQDSRHPRQVLMKSRIETGHLWHPGVLFTECFDQGDFGRQMFRLVRAEPVQFLHHLRRHHHRVCITAATVHDPMADRMNRQSLAALRELLDEHLYSRGVVGHLNGSSIALPASRIGGGENSVRETDPLKFSRAQSCGLSASTEQCPSHTG